MHTVRTSLHNPHAPMNWGTVPDWIAAITIAVTALMTGLTFYIRGWARTEAQKLTNEYTLPLINELRRAVSEIKELTHRHPPQ